MSELELKLQFQKIVKGVNIITPIILKYINVNNHIIEISTNKDVYNTFKLYGVTVITKNDNGKYYKNNELTTCFPTLDKVNNYLEEIKNNLL